MTTRIGDGYGCRNRSRTQPIDDIAIVESQGTESAGRRERADELVARDARRSSLQGDRVDACNSTWQVQELPRRIHLQRPQREKERQLLVAPRVVRNAIANVQQ